jgi:MerR family transcriptional regulator/heat shock protein HspR
MSRKSRNKAAYMISAVAESYGIHPQTLRLYEREGLLKPSRTEGNTRLYTERDMERLELILSLTRDLGVNLAGVEVVLNMRDKMEQMQQQMREFVSMVQREMVHHARMNRDVRNALVRFVPRPAAPARVKRGSGQ